MKKIISILCLLAICYVGRSQSTLYPGIQNPAKEYIPGSGWTSDPSGYIYLPWDYDITSKKYPIIFFFPGDGEKGGDLDILLNAGLPKSINDGNPPYSVNSDGDTTWFIVVSPHIAAGTQVNQYGMEYWWQTVIQYNLKFDTGRVYFTGLSAGGNNTQDLIQNSKTVGYDWKPAAEVVMSPGTQLFSSNIPNMDLSHIWYLTGSTDGTSKAAINFDALVSAYPDNDYRFTTYPGGHCCWDTYYDPTFKQGDSSLYDYLMTFSRDTTGPTPPDTADYKLTLDPNLIMYSGDTSFLQMNDPFVTQKTQYLIDEQGADPLNGVETPTPVTVYESSNSAIYRPTWAIIDLGGFYKLTHEYLYNNQGTATMYIQYGTPDNWSNDTLSRGEGGIGWGDYGDTIYTRYLKVFNGSTGYQKSRELILYGHLIGDSLSRINPDTAYPLPPMNKFIGVNIYGVTPPQVSNVGSTLRKYTNQEYLDTVPAGLNVDSVEFVFTRFSGTGGTESYYFPYGRGEGPLLTWNTNTEPNGFPHWDSLGTDLYWSLKSIPQYAIDSSWGKSIDYSLFPDASGTDPEQYDRLSRMAWTLGAVFGSNTYPPDSVQELVYDHQSGLGGMHYIEAGNENNGSWLTTSTYYNPQQAIAYMSAFYDGDNERMGSRFGVKNADDTIQVLFWGDANSHMPYLKSMWYWAYYNRQNHTLPFDIWNIHTYTYDTTGISPENWKDIGVRQFYRNLVDTAHIICPRCQTWLSEWGYDRNRQSPLAVPVIAGLDSAQIQAMWIARSWFMLSFSGLDRAQIFQIQNDALTKDYDSTGIYKFNTTGLTDGHQDKTDFQLNYYAYQAYYYQHTIWESLYNYKPDSIIYEDNDSIWVYRYKNVVNDSVAYAIWSGTQTNRSTDDYVIKTGHANTTQQLLTLENGYMNGDTSLPVSDANGEIPVTITESPILLFTTTGTDGGQLVDTSGSETPPTANAGGDQTIRLPVNSVTLDGSGTAGSSDIFSHVWSVVSGTGATITDPNSYTSTVTGLSQGLYVLKLVVTDENGLADSDNMTITVNAAYVGPTAHAGDGQEITLPVDQVTLDGSATAGDGTITSHTWTKLSGTGGTITDPSSYTSTFTGLIEGSYELKLRVTDSNGLSDSDSVVIVVNAAIINPVASAGPDQTITLPTNEVTMAGSGTQGTYPIESHVWTKQSGGAATITDATDYNTTITGLEEGFYTFRLTVTDNEGNSAHSDMTVTVNAQPPATNGKVILRMVNGNKVQFIYTN